MSAPDLFLPEVSKDDPMIIDVFGGVHGRKEEIGIRVVGLIEAGPYENVQSWYPHPELLARGDERHLGPEQMQACWNGGGDSPEHRAADEMKHVLGTDGEEVRVADNIALYDIHQSLIPGIDFVSVGSKYAKAPLAGALMLSGSGRVVIRPDSFRENTHGIVVETSTRSKEDVEPAAQRIYKELGVVASLSVAELELIYLQFKKRLVFLKPHEYKTADIEPGLLRIMESYDYSHLKPFQDMDLPDELAEPLELGDAVMGSWGHDNMSKKIEALGVTANGVQRSDYFGEIYEVVEAPD